MTGEKQGNIRLVCGSGWELPALLWRSPVCLFWTNPLMGWMPEGYEFVRKIILEERCNGTRVILACHNREELESLSDVIYLIWNCSIS